VIEFWEREPAMYVPEDGFLCEDADHVEHWVSLDGRVDRKLFGKWQMGVGVCAKLKNEMDLITAALDGKMQEYENLHANKAWESGNMPQTGEI